MFYMYIALVVALFCYFQQWTSRYPSSEPRGSRCGSMQHTEYSAKERAGIGKFVTMVGPQQPEEDVLACD